MLVKASANIEQQWQLQSMYDQKRFKWLALLTNLVKPSSNENKIYEHMCTVLCHIVCNPAITLIRRILIICFVKYKRM
jgi:hypothetical protein